MTAEKLWKKALKHAIYLVLATVIGHVFLAYFASARQLGAMIDEGPAAHPGTFAWAIGLTVLIYGNFWWFREQLCIVICPYGRLQSVLQDQDTINVIYDAPRGEPRGKAKAKAVANLGDCVDCFRCVAVCPTQIDIRSGSQLECIGCGYCADACDEVMLKLGRKPGLIRHDSVAAVQGRRRSFWRPRVFFYGFMGILGFLVATIVIANNDDFEAEVLRTTGTPFLVAGGFVENQLRINCVNKDGARATFRVTPAPESAPFITLAQPEVTLEAFAEHDLPVVVRIPVNAWKRGIALHLSVTSSASPEVKQLELEVLGPHRVARPGGATP